MTHKLRMIVAAAFVVAGLTGCWVQVPADPGHVHCMPYEPCK